MYNLVNDNRESRHSKLRTGASEWLSTSLDGVNIVRARQAVAVNKVGQEQFGVAAEACDRTVDGYETENAHGAVVAVVELPWVPSNGDCGNCASWGRDGAGTAVGSEPNHDLVGGGAAARSGGKEDVVGDIGDNSTGVSVTNWWELDLGF